MILSLECSSIDMNFLCKFNAINRFGPLPKLTNIETQANKIQSVKDDTNAIKTETDRMSFDTDRIRANSNPAAPINEAPSPNIPVVDMSLADDETLAQMSLMPSADLGLDKDLKPVFNRLMAQRQLRINGDEFADLFKSLSWDGKTPSPLGEHFSTPQACNIARAHIQPMI